MDGLVKICKGRSLKFPPGCSPLRSPLDALKDGEPAFMELSRSAVLAAIEALRAAWQLPLEKLAIGGFSQGAGIGQITRMIWK